MKSTVKKRKVFYLAGFDPRPSKFYYDLYGRESALWATITNKSVDISELNTERDIENTFTINNNSDEVQTDYSFLNWNYVVKDYWNFSLFTLIYYFLAYYISTLRSTNWRYIANISSGPVKAYFFPLIFIIAGSIGVGLLFNVAFNSLFGSGHFFLTKLISGLLIFALVTYILMLKIKPFWILRAMAFKYIVLKEEQGILMTQIDALAKILADFFSQEAGNYDEILLVSHSFGTLLSPIILNQVRHELQSNALPKNFTVITLAQQSPSVTCYKNATPFHKRLKELSTHSEGFDWLDISSPADGICFHACNPFQPICDEGKINLVYKSPRFHTVYTKEEYDKIKENKFLLHFKYLYSTNKNSPTNYFQITAGNTSIKDLLNA